jgi:hypothetical protein
MLKLEIVPEIRLRVVHSSLIIRGHSIYEATGLNILQFARKHDLAGATNGGIWLMAEMAFPWDYLEQVAVEILQKNGLEEKEDFILTYERDCYSNPFESGYLYRDIPELEGLDWVDSIILETGNWIWQKEF